MTLPPNISRALARAIDLLSKWWVRDTTFGVLITFSALLLADSFIEIVLPKLMEFGGASPSARVVEHSFGVADRVGLAAFVLAVIYKIFIMATDRFQRRDLAETEFLSTNYTDRAVEQKAHERAWGVIATTPEINALKKHPTDVLGAQRSRALGARHVRFDGTWYVLKSTHHRRKKLATVGLLVLASIVAVTAFVFGCWSMAYPSYREQATILILEAIFMAFMASSYISDLSRYYAAEYLVSICPPIQP